VGKDNTSDEEKRSVGQGRDEKKIGDGNNGYQGKRPNAHVGVRVCYAWWSCNCGYVIFFSAIERNKKTRTLN
jgi:hypothetical protein